MRATSKAKGMMPDQALDSIIIGAGISGLCAGWALRKAGSSYTILERNTRAGGPIQTIQEDGFQFELGPNTIQMDGVDLETLFEELGLQGALLEANPEANKRYIVRDHTPRAVPTRPSDFFSTKLFSKRAMLGVLLEPFKKKYSNHHDESLGSFVRRRLNQEFLDYAINPLIGGIYAGDPERLSTRHGFPKIYDLEAKYGSLIKGSIGIRKERKKLGTLYKTRLVSFREGMEKLPQTLATIQKDRLILGADIIQIESNPDRIWKVTYTKGASKISVQSKNLIVACPAAGIRQLPFPNELARKLEPISEIPHPPVTGLSLGFKKTNIQHALDGFGMLVPEVEKMSILGCLFSSTLFEGRAPGDASALTVFIGGTRNPELTHLNDSELTEHVLRDLNTLLGLQGSPTYFRRTDWPRAIPQYVTGFEKYLKLFEDLEHAYPGLQFIGHIKDGIAVPKCIRSGLSVTEGLR